MTVERDILSKLHLNALLLSICSKLNIKLAKSVKDINFYAHLQPESAGSMESFLTINDIESIAPIVKDYLDQMLTQLPLIAPQDQFPCSLRMIQESARLKDLEGK